MFYSVDILTRKGRLGLIWLAATYGDSKKGMANRDFRKVNIPRACHDIVNPVVPFALRLSSNLMIGVVRIYRKQTQTVWVEVAQMWKTIKNASGLRPSEIDMINQASREEAITDTLDLTTESFRWDLEVHSIALIGQDAYFAVNGNSHPSPLISPPPAAGQFSPPSIPGTPVQQRSPEWRVLPGSDHEQSPHAAASAAHISIPEINHIRIREDELIKIPDEVEITEDSEVSPQPAVSRSPRPRSRSPRQQPRSPRARSRSPRARSRSPRARSRSPRARSRSPRARSRSPRVRSRSPRARSRSPPARSRSPRARSRSPRARSRSPRARSRSPRARSRSPRARSRSPRARSRSPRVRSRSPRARSRSPRARSRSPRARSRSPRARSRSPRARSRSPRARSRSPRARSRSPRRLSRSPRTRSKSPRHRSRSPRSPQRRSPQRRDDQLPASRASSPPAISDPLDEEPSLARVLTLEELTGVLEAPVEPGEDEIPTTVVREDEVPVPPGLVTPGVPITTVIPSPPQKRRRLAIDRNIQLDADVIRRNVDTEGRETLQERRLDEYPLKAVKDLFTTPATEALLSHPFLDLWKRNAVTVPKDYSSSESGVSDEGSPLPIQENFEVARSMETPREKELVRADAPGEGSGLFERSEANSSDLTPAPHDSGMKAGDLSASGDRGISTDLTLEEPPPRGRSSSILRPSISGLLSPIQEPSDSEFSVGEIGELPTLIEQSEVTQPLEEQAYETFRLVTKAMGDSHEPVMFRNLCPPQSTARKSAAKVFYHLLSLHKNGVFELKQRDPYNLTNIYIHKGMNF